ncbi:hypothetical protein KIN20_013706 [Parelaphostrongylus tenuis]|uniref:Uncharacterized protein n=1 Tax=Parelaphostrongylus tenuis TaxID=148309 RepID=A0AAD5MUW2_PARTN|nr:hypothetical protein KIN20_013706 [Parelaphostrongylus tenuis]
MSRFGWPSAVDESDSKAALNAELYRAIVMWLKSLNEVGTPGPYTGVYEVSASSVRHKKQICCFDAGDLDIEDKPRSLHPTTFELFDKAEEARQVFIELNSEEWYLE